MLLSVAGNGTLLGVEIHCWTRQDSSSQLLQIPPLPQPRRKWLNSNAAAVPEEPHSVQCPACPNVTPPTGGTFQQSTLTPGVFICFKYKSGSLVTYSGEFTWEVTLPGTSSLI